MDTAIARAQSEASDAEARVIELSRRFSEQGADAVAHHNQELVENRKSELGTGKGFRPTSMLQCSWQRCACTCYWVILLLLWISWEELDRRTCISDCNQIGTYLDLWYRREVFALPETTESQPINTVMQYLHADSPHPPHRNMSVSISQLDTKLFDWGKATFLRGILDRLDRHSFGAHTYARTAVSLPPEEFWNTSEGKVSSLNCSSLALPPLVALSSSLTG